VSTPNLVGENEGSAESVEDDMTNFWPTSAGKFHFCIEELPQELQYIHQLLQARLLVKTNTFLGFVAYIRGTGKQNGMIIELHIRLSNLKSEFLWFYLNLYSKFIKTD
jgi:protein unc-79